ncbi:MAG TPA: AsmA-like C-terminal domain-containing protein, partial [Candidatus Hydrogenedentes bacterium]|nr:AsmA-like C-terminal domain-containing protein [Candidatus Hydrogenedentota bacterium]
TGPAVVHAYKRAGEPDIVIEVSLDDADVVMGRYLHKHAGGAASVTARGDAGPDGWRLRDVHVDCLGESVLLTLDADGGMTASLDIELAPLVRLLPEGGSAKGHVTGTIATVPLDVRLMLADAGLGLSADAAIDSMNGEILFQDGYLSCRDVRVLGADSDCTISASFEGDHWKAQVVGEKLDLDAFTTLIDAVQSVRAENDAAATAPTTDSGAAFTRGEIALQLKSLYYRRGRLDDVNARIRIGPEDILFDEVTATPYTGNASGRARLARQTQPNRLALELSLQDVDVRILDDILFESPRELAGAATGAVELDFPLAEAEDALRDVSGRIDLEIAKGSYGKLGTVSRALSFFRVLEFIRLSAPALGTKGLTFDKSQLKLTAEKGVIALDTFTITSKSYAIDGFGTLNYRDDAADVIVRVNLLELVTGIITRVPILGGAVDRLSSYADLVVHVGGSPFSPQFSLRPSIGSRKPS